jgi:hypothetical protein
MQNLATLVSILPMTWVEVAPVETNFFIINDVYRSLVGPVCQLQIFFFEMSDALAPD